MEFWSCRLLAHEALFLRNWFYQRTLFWQGGQLPVSSLCHRRVARLSCLRSVVHLLQPADYNRLLFGPREKSWTCFKSHIPVLHIPLSGGNTPFEFSKIHCDICQLFLLLMIIALCIGLGVWPVVTSRPCYVALSQKTSCGLRWCTVNGCLLL